MRRIAFLPLIIWFMSPFAIGASFDCKQAESDVEKLICKNYKLSRLDEDLEKRYRLKLTSSSTPDALRAEQRNWLRKTRNQCSTVECLKTAYEERIEQLVIVIGTLKLGDSPGDVQVMSKATVSNCELSVVSKSGAVLQAIEVLRPWCPEPHTFKSFDPNADGYDDFVIITGAAAKAVTMGAWVYRPEKKIFERDYDYPGGWPINDRCTTVEFSNDWSRTYCYNGKEWNE